MLSLSVDVLPTFMDDGGRTDIYKLQRFKPESHRPTARFTRSSSASPHSQACLLRHSPDLLFLPCYWPLWPVQLPLVPRRQQVNQSHQPPSYLPALFLCLPALPRFPPAQHPCPAALLPLAALSSPPEPARLMHRPARPRCYLPAHNPQPHPKPLILTLPKTRTV